MSGSPGAGGGSGGALSASASSSNSSNSRYAVFDGSTDFQLWRARVENELLRFHLLGYIRVRDYDGSQAFEYNGEEIPPKCALVPAADDAAATVAVKDEPVVAGDALSANGTATSTAAVTAVTGKKRSHSEHMHLQQGRLTRLQVVAERAEAMGILQRYLHPEVERAILGKNIFDSWETLCGMYGNRNVSDFYKVHRLMHAMRLGEKDESARDFIARLELMMEQYAQIAGIQLTDPFRSMLLAHALPPEWAPMLDVWKAFKPYIPYVQLVEKVVFEHSSRLVLKEREDALAKAKPTEKPSQKTSLTIETKESSLSHTSSATEPSAGSLTKEYTSSSTKTTPDKAKTSSSSSSRMTDKYDDKSESSKYKEKRDDHKASSSDKHSSHYDKRDDKKDDRRYDKHYDSRRSDDRSYDKKRDDDKRDDDRREYKKDDRRDKEYYHSNSSTSYEKRDSHYNNSSNTGGGYRDKRDYSSNNGNPEKRMVCFYCLKVGHCFQACWFLRVDVENDSYKNNHKKYSATVTNDRTAYMVQRIEQYVKEMRRERNEKSISELAQPSPRGFTDHRAMRSKSSFREESTFSYGRNSHEGSSHHDAHAQEAQLAPRTGYSQVASMRSQSMFREPIPQQQQQYGYDDSSRLESDVERYKKRSRSVFGDEPALLETSQLHDPHSRSVFRQSETSGYRTADPSRRSASPIQSTLHRSYSSNSNMF